MRPGILAGAAVLLLLACSRPPEPRSAAELRPPPGDVYAVQIMHAPPQRLYNELGQVFIEPQGDETAAELERDLRAGGARLGAEAVVLVQDATGKLGPAAGTAWLKKPIPPRFLGGVLGKAIKFYQFEPVN